jgi:hypothetical protein
MQVEVPMPKRSPRPEIIIELARQAHERIASQRNFEFQISLTIWGALVALIYALLSQGPLKVCREWLFAGIFVVGGTMVGTFWYWLSRLVKRYNLYKREFRHWEKQLMWLSGAAYPPQIRQLRGKYYPEGDGGLTSFSEQNRGTVLDELRPWGLDWGTWPKFLLAVVFWVFALVLAWLV